MRIAELFQSIQGEGEFAGTPSVFLRTTGCNLRCWFCDTPYASFTPEGIRRDWASILEEILSYDCMHVVVTGGEPLLQPAVVPLVTALRRECRIVTIETAGTVFRPVAVDLMSISPKLSNSLPAGTASWQQRHERDRHRPQALSQLISQSPYQLKFVVDQPDDLTEIVDYLRTNFPQIAKDRIWLMPQGIKQEDLLAKQTWLLPATEELGFRYCTRHHIRLFGNTRGT